jgi:hypothetical protein
MMTNATDIVPSIDKRARYSDFEAGRVSTPTRPEKTNVSGMAGAASRPSGEASDMQEAAG